jgi:spermidine synthase
MWFVDKNSPYHWIYHRVKKHVVSVRTPFQKVDIIDTHEFGRMVVLDGQIQSAESDEFIYHEILVHPAMITHPKPKYVLILGAGEGATLREVLKHPTVKKVVMIDIDREFVNLCKEHLRKWHKGSFRNEKVELVYDDAFSYLQNTANRFDVIIADISDPTDKGPAHSVYTAKFYTMIKKVLTPDGIFVTNATAVYYMTHKNYSSGIMKKLLSIFPKVDPYYEYIPSFGSLWLYATGSFRYSPGVMSSSVIERKLKQRGIEKLFYYNPGTHGRLFTMPPCMQRNVPIA